MLKCLIFRAKFGQVERLDPDPEKLPGSDDTVQDLFYECTVLEVGGVGGRQSGEPNYWTQRDEENKIFWNDSL